MSDRLRDLLDESPGEERSRPPAWIWLLVVAVIVALVALVFRLTQIDEEAAETTLGASITSTSSVAVLTPPARSHARLAPLGGADRLLLFGGTTRVGGFGPYAEHAWTLDPTDETWRQVGSPSPPPRIAHAMEAVDNMGAVVVFGGGRRGMSLGCLSSPCAPGFLGDMWLFLEATDAWEEILVRGGPSPRAGHAMAYDPISDRLVLFGGMVPPVGPLRTATLAGDTWMFDPSTTVWERVETDLAPEPRAFHAMVYHQASGSILLWGGRIEDRDGDPSVWRFEVGASTWTEVAPLDLGRPASRWGHIWSSEPRSGLIVLVGGTWFDEGRARYGQDVWTYDPAANVWEAQRSIDGPVPWGDAASTHAGTVVVFVSGLTGYYDPTSDAWRWLPALE